MTDRTTDSLDPSIHRVNLDDDLEELIAAINSATWDASNEIVPYTLDSLTTYVSPGNTHFLIARLSDQFAGMASATVLLKPHSVGPWLYVDEVDVAVPFRRRGVGRALMKAMIDIGEEKSCTEVWLGAERDNEAAIALYNALDPDERMEFVGFTYETD